jgi:hypothetical protein
MSKKEQIPAGHDLAEQVPGYPAPIAQAYAGLAASSSPLERLFALKDLFEVTLKYCAIIMLLDYLRSGLDATAVDSAIAQHLARPQLGDWNQILRETTRCFQTRREKAALPQLADYYYEPGGAPRGRRHELTDTLISFRNKVLAHRARPRAQDAEETFEEKLPLVERFLSELSFLKDYPLLHCTGPDLCELHMGTGSPAPAAAALPADSGVSTGHLFVQGDGVSLGLFPLMLYDRCGHGKPPNVCDLTKFFFFNGGERKPEFLDYSMSHVKQVIDTVPILQQIISDCRNRLNLEIGQAASAASRDLMSKMVLGFVGRASEESEILKYVSEQDRGVVTVVGDPGIGKSALLSRVVLDLTERGEAQERSAAIADLCSQLQQTWLAVAYHVCTRRAVESTAVPQIISSLAEQLTKRYGPSAGVPQERSLPALMELARLARARFAGKALLVIDAVDEVLYGLSPTEQREVLRSLPVEGLLPEGVFVLLSSRRGYLDLEPDQAHQMELHGLARDDVRQLLDEAGVVSLNGDKHIDGILRVSQSNALYVRMLVNDLKQGNITLDKIDQLPRELEGYFEGYIKRLSVDPAWPALRDCLLLLAVARSHLSVNQVWAMTEFAWAEVEEAVEDKLQPVLVPASTETRSYQLFHEKFREFLLALFSGRLSPEVASRLDKHFVREAPRELRAEGEVAAAIHLARARERLLNYCRRWRELDDDYPVRHLPRHLYEAGAGDELETLLRRTDFAEEKARRLGNPLLVAEDFRYLTFSLLDTQNDSKLVDLAITENGYQRDGVASALRVAGPDRAERIAEVAKKLLARRNPRPSRLAQAWSRISGLLPGRRALPAAILNARRVALEAAYGQGFGDLLVSAAQDRSQSVRTLLAPYLYRYWHRNSDAGWALMDRFSETLLGRLGLPNGRSIECYGGMCLAILIYHSDEAETIERLHDHWKQNVRRILHMPDQAGRTRAFLLSSGLRTAIFVLTRMLKLLMAAQPTFQPINLREMAASFSRPGAEQQLGLKVLEGLEHPERGFHEAIDVVMDTEVPFGVYLMMILERTFVFHGAREPAAMMRALYRVHRDGCAWFRQSALYAAFHTLNRADRADDELLDLYAQMTRETITSTSATFQTPRATYDLVPHMAWAEIVFDKHRPQGRAQFIPAFYADAKAKGDLDYARRVIGACVILSLAYRRHDLALKALLAALHETDPALRAAVAEALCNIRFHVEEAVDRFLETENAGEMAELVAGSAPTLTSNDIFGWIDDYMNYITIHSDGFREEIVGAFRRAGHAGGVTEVLQQVLKWVINMSMGEKFLPL